MRSLRVKKLDEQALAEKIRSKHLNPENIWRDVEAIQPFGCSPLRACCELTFLRVAVMKSVIERTQSRFVKSELFALLDRLVAAEFDHSSAEALSLYNGPLSAVAEGAIAQYYKVAANPSDVALLLVQRVNGSPARLKTGTNLVAIFGTQFGTSLRKYRFKVHGEPARRFAFLQPA